MAETDEQKERRLEMEAGTLCIGELGDRAPATDHCRVEVSYTDAEGREYAGFYRVHVRVYVDPEADEDEQLANHPATLATVLVERDLEQQATAKGWTYTSVDDVYPD